MNRHLPILLLFLTLAMPLSIAKPKKPTVPEAFSTAHTVFVETRDARDITDIGLDPETRNAILDLQDAIEHWGRYTLSRSRHDADLVFVLYKGRLSRDPATLTAPGGVRSPLSHSPVQNPADASQESNNPNNPDGFTQEKDELRIYAPNPDGKLKNLLWHGEEEHGLDTPRLQLLQRLKYEVDTSYPPTPAKPQPTP